MNLFGAGDGANTSEPRIGSFKVMSQGYGVTVPVIMGTNRVQCTLIDYLDFYSIAHTQSQGGKGGGGGGNTTYTYYATVLLLVGEGVGAGVTFGKLWVNKDRYETPDLRGFAEFGGTEDTGPIGADGNPDGRQFKGGDGQAPWAYMSGKHPDHAVPYQGFAYLAAHDYELTRSASLGNHGVEVHGFYATEGVGLDAPIADCITGLLLDAQWGADFGANRLLSLSQLDDYCQSYGLVMSPALTEQKPAHELLGHWAQIANADMVWSQNAAGDGGALKILPLSLAAHSGNGRNYLPIAPLDIHLTEDDFLDDGGDSESVVCSRSNRGEAYNAMTVEFKARSHEYNKLTTPVATDAAAIQLYGLRKAPVFVADEITLMPVARRVAQNMLQAAQYRNNTYEAQLSSWRYCYLEPMDVVYVSYPELGLADWPVMITSVSDDGDMMRVTFVDALDFIGHSENYAGDDVVYQRVPWNTPVGNINTPSIFHAPAALTATGRELWVAIAHRDPNYGGCQVWASFADENYWLAGSMNGHSVCGVLTADFVAGPDPDTNPAHVLSVDLSESHGAVYSVSQGDAENYRSLCLVGNEFVAYRDAHLVGGHYDLTTPNPVTITSTATAVVSAGEIQFNGPGDGLTRASHYYQGGVITCTAGTSGNVGVTRTIAGYTNAAGVKTIACAAFPVVPVVGDVFELTALPYLRRGLYIPGGTLGAVSGDRFVLCDTNHLFRLPYEAKNIGKRLYLKFLAYNQFGQARQSLADVSAYSIVLADPPQGVVAVDTFYQWVNE